MRHQRRHLAMGDRSGDSGRMREVPRRGRRRACAQRQRTWRGKLHRRRARRRQSGAGMHERLRRADGQCQPHHHHTNAGAQNGAQMHSRWPAEKSTRHVALHRRSCQPAPRHPRTICRRNLFQPQRRSARRGRPEQSRDVRARAAGIGR